MKMETEIRSLTRKEQLEYYVPFLENQILALQIEFDKAKEELEEENKKELILERKKENDIKRI